MVAKSRTGRTVIDYVVYPIVMMFIIGALMTLAFWAAATLASEPVDDATELDIFYDEMYVSCVKQVENYEWRHGIDPLFGATKFCNCFSNYLTREMIQPRVYIDEATTDEQRERALMSLFWTSTTLRRGRTERELCLANLYFDHQQMSK